MAYTILVVDDEDNMRWVLNRALEQAGYEVLTANRGDKALQSFARHRIDLVLLDLKMPGMDGLGVLRELRQRSPDVPILLLTAFASVPTAVGAFQAGATDYIRKPFDIENLLTLIARYLSQQANHAIMQQEAHSSSLFSDFIGADPSLHRPLAQAEAAVRSLYTVLLQGESGAGRRHLARLIHHHTQSTARRRLVTVDCAALPAALLGQELLHDSNEGGRWQMALGGSLLLANVDSLEEPLLAPLVEHLSFYVWQPERPNGLRLLLTTTNPLSPTWTPITEKALRVELPPLRQRLSDLPLLLADFAPGAVWNEDAKVLLAAYAWPSNVAEFQRVVQQAARLAGDEPVQAHHLPTYLMQGNLMPTGGLVLPPDGIELETVEQALIQQALTLARGNKTQAARLLGLTRATLLYRLEKYGMGSTGADLAATDSVS